MPTENKIDCPALHQRSDSYPFGDRVPRTVRMLKTVTADPMPGIGLAYIKGDAPVAKEGQTYPVWTNSHGAVTAVMEDGTRLGLRPEEFEVDSWHHIADEQAPQPHPEPIAWMVGTAIWWTKEEAERDAAETGKTITPIGPMPGIAPAEEHQGEPVALPRKLTDSSRSVNQRGEGFIEGWNACIDEIAKLGPLYTHVDSGEVERLREGMKYESERAALCLEELQECESQRDEFYAEITGLRAKLAERDALLRKCLMAVREQHCDDGEADFDLPAALMVEIDAALSASAEPRACEHDWIDARNQFVQSGELCIKCHAIRAGNVTLERKPS